MRIVVVAAVWTVGVQTAHAQEPIDNADDSVVFSSRTYARLFRRATASGPGGADMNTATHLPIVQYLSLWGGGIDSPIGSDTVSLEVTAWSAAQLADSPAEGPRQADLQTAFVTFHSPQGWPQTSLRLGRQTVAGGAARFSRFDGVTAEVRPLPQLFVAAYGGWTALPRWDEQPGYYRLGAEGGVFDDDAEVIRELDRKQYSLGGGRIGFVHPRAQATLSFHEQREAGELGRRTLGFDGHAAPFERVDLGAGLVMDVDSMRLASARIYSDFQVAEPVDITLQYLKSEPALLLSRQSVLSVFSTDGYHELGASGRYRLSEAWSFEGSGWSLFYDDSEPGYRASGGVRFAHTKFSQRTVATANYGRVYSLKNGYHFVRAALSQGIAANLTCTLQGFLYLYDEATSEFASSLVHAATLEYGFAERWALLWGGTVASTPYASIDASTQLRLSYELRTSDRGSSW